MSTRRAKLLSGENPCKERQNKSKGVKAKDLIGCLAALAERLAMQIVYRLILRHVSGYEGYLEHWHHDTFLARWGNCLYGAELIVFALDVRGQVAELRGSGVSFTRAA
jgi:hypothetical protein